MRGFLRCVLCLQGRETPVKVPLWVRVRRITRHIIRRPGRRPRRQRLTCLPLAERRRGVLRRQPILTLGQRGRGVLGCLQGLVELVLKRSNPHLGILPHLLALVLERLNLVMRVLKCLRMTLFQRTQLILRSRPRAVLRRPTQLGARLWLSTHASLPRARRGRLLRRCRVRLMPRLHFLQQALEPLRFLHTWLPRRILRRIGVRRC